MNLSILIEAKGMREKSSTPFNKIQQRSHVMAEKKMANGQKKKETTRAKNEKNIMKGMRGKNKILAKGAIRESVPKFMSVIGSVKT